MTVALAFESDDGSRAIEMQVQVQESDGVRNEDCDLRVYYDIARTVDQIRRGGYKKIALQFPDSLLPDASQVQQELKDGLTGQWERVFILGDTSYGSCCVDEVAAQHLVADCIVHYGRTCLSATTKIPVIYVFGNAPIEVNDCVQQLSERIASVDVMKTLVLLYEPRFHHASSAVFEGLKEKFAERKLVFGTMKTLYDPTKKLQEIESSKADEGSSVLTIGGQEIVVDTENVEITPETFTLLYIGAESAHLTSILMRYSSVECFSYNPDLMSTRKEGATVNRALMRRFFLVQQAKEAQIYGILMGTLGVNKYLDVVHGLQKLIKKSGRKSYLFVVGKVNVPKLANYAEIDAFVLVACQQNTLMDSKEYYKPIVTPYELQLALSPSEEWDGQYKTDFSEVIPALDQTAQSVEQAAVDGEDEADKPFFSLVSGTYKTASHSTAVDREATTYALTASGEPDASGALQVKNERTELTTYHSEAADYLATREYQGLDPRIGKTPAHAAVEGSTAIDNYKRIGERIAKDKGQDLSIVLNAITSVMSSKGDPRFIVLENSSGTGKTQMAFNLQTSGSCDVFYLPCAKVGDDAQLVYKAFSKRTVAFLGCINEAAEKLNEGSVAEFYGAKELRLYAFIVAALRGDESFRGLATSLEVEQGFREKKIKPFVFFLDEFARLGSSYAGDERKIVEKRLRLVRNVFRSFGIPVILSATNRIARKLVCFEKVLDRRRRCSKKLLGDGDGRVSKAMLLTQLEWILQHSRPLFAILARQYMTKNGNFGTTPADRIRYLSDMTAKLARVIRSLKERGRPNEFFYRVADTCTNLIDSHFGCLEESEPFDLNLGSCGLLKDEENWKCSGKFPQLESDMLLHLILMGDHEMEEG
ncbi:diphthamide biosynthesis protein 2 [Phytophthora nicotianae]|uniref:2-(3-amino-3-carboxypropyl)histidine synthase subunit 2 n=1 Tax=Phytophthora nicotianae TaxID=4792 RepID=W2K8N9_PHYNI|nr:diphthamide biosynthesis protein 2 [Phytophthora nicotianae]